MTVDNLADVDINSVERRVHTAIEGDDTSNLDEVDDEVQDIASIDPAQDAATADGEVSGRPDERGAVRRRFRFAKFVVFGVLPGLALLIAMVAAFLKWEDSSVRSTEQARLESVDAAKATTVAMLSYEPDTIESELGAAGDRLSGTFKESYTALIHDVVIPGAKQRRISAVANVPAVSSISASANRAVVMAFVNQTVIVGTDPPADTASVVRVTLEKVGGRWLVSQFEPI